MSILLALVLASIPASVESPRPAELRYDLTLDLPYTGTTFVSWALAETVLKDSFAPSQCHWCNPPAFDSSIRDSLKWQNPVSANVIGSFTGFVGAPLAALGGLAIAGSHDDSHAFL